MPKQQKSKNNNEKEKVNYKNVNILILILSIFPIFIAITAFFYLNFTKFLLQQRNSLKNISTNYIYSYKDKKQLPHILLHEPNKPKTEQSPINGELFTKEEMDKLMKKRPVAVMISNHADARPLSGLSSADLVIETLVEWGITRNIAFFWSKTPEKVGSVRSARQYFLEWLSPYDPLYIHVGCASTTNPRTNACDHLFSYNIKDVSYYGSWRSNDGGRIAPHNAYSSVSYAREYGSNRGWSDFPNEFESWKFKNDLDISIRGDGNRYKIVFHKSLNNRGFYDTIWEYDRLTNSYKRFVGGEMDIDEENNEQITAKVIIIQKIKMVSAYDDKGRLIQDTIGEGDSIFLMDGDIIYGKWEKTDRMDRTSYYDSKNNEIEFNRGLIWIAAISNSVGEFEIIE